MARGLTGVVDHAKEVASRPRGGGNFKPELRIGQDETVVVRFLEQDEDVVWANCHPIDRITKTGKQYQDFMVCLDEDEQGVRCPGCEQGLAKRFRGWINVIHRNAPKIVRDSEGKALKDSKGNWVFDGVEDQVKTWSQGINAFETLADKNRKYKGLMSRDFEISRRGSGAKTVYPIEPFDPDAGAVAMTPADIELAQNKTDLNEYSRVLSYEEATDFINGIVAQKITDAPPPSNKNPFKR